MTTPMGCTTETIPLYEDRRQIQPRLGCRATWRRLSSLRCTPWAYFAGSPPPAEALVLRKESLLRRVAAELRRAGAAASAAKAETGCATAWHTPSASVLTTRPPGGY